MATKGKTHSQKSSILWVSDTQPLDVFLHKTALMSMVTEFEELGHRVTLVAARSANVSQSRKSRVHMILFPLRFTAVISPIMYALAILLFLPLLVCTSKPDFVIIEYDISTVSSLPAVLISKLRKVRFVLDIRSIPVELNGHRSSFHKLKFSVSVLMAKKLFDGVTILTPLMKKEICDRFELDPNKVGVWTSGVSDGLFNPEASFEKGVEIKNILGLNRKFVVFYHGIFTPTRGLAETIDAVKMLLPRYPDIVFFLLGTGSMTSVLNDLIQRERLQENIIIHHSVVQEEVPKFISMCDVGIVPLPNHPYWRYQSPLKLLEYLSMGKVVILTDIPAHRAVVGEARCGIYVSSARSSEIAKSIEYAYFNRESLAEWGKAGRAIVRKSYSWERIARDLENYLLSVDRTVASSSKSGEE